MDRIYRPDALQSMTDDEYKDYLDKKAQYAKDNPIDPNIMKLAESMKGMPYTQQGPAIAPVPPQLDSGLIPTQKSKEVEQSFREATGLPDTDTFPKLKRTMKKSKD